MTIRPQRLDGPARAPLTILVVDDDPETLRYVGSLLIAEGYRVHIAGEGRLAIEIARAVQLDLVLLDIRMPELTGIETCRLLKQGGETRGIPVVFLTGRGDEPAMLEAFDAGGADYVVKPFDARILLARVRTHAELGALSRGLERALAERTRELQDANAALRRLAAEVSMIAETEKGRLAAELHDGPMQKLALAQMQINAALGAEVVAEPAPDASARWSGEGQEHLAAGLALMGEAISELRTLQFALSPPVLHERGLAAALDWLAGDTRARWGIALTCNIEADLPAIDRQASVIVFLCVRELVCNLIRHARAKSGVVALSRQPDGLLLTVSDDGRGFAASVRDPAGPARSQGYGLHSVRERVALLGGTLAVESDASGSRLTIRLPLPLGDHAAVTGRGAPDSFPSAPRAL